MSFFFFFFFNLMKGIFVILGYRRRTLQSQWHDAYTKEHKKERKKK
jgi:hypothetical protein